MAAATAAPPVTTATAARPSLVLSLHAFRCWLTVYRRIWRSSIWSSVLGPLFYLGAMGVGLGTLVDRHGPVATASLGGVSYLAFVAPAILASGAMNAAMSEASYPVFGSVKWNKIYIAAQASPLRPSDIFRGHLMFMTMRIAMNAAVVSSSKPSAKAARFSVRPCPYGCSVSAGLRAVRTATRVKALAARSRKECAASLRMPRLPVRTPTTSLAKTSATPTPTEPRATSSGRRSSLFTASL